MEIRNMVGKVKELNKEERELTIALIDYRYNMTGYIINYGRG